ncbi:MAG: GxxExxY protein [Candidatus Aminicenantes bacterium]|nr:GxxExxY protein [Candidatus Aminicenantes bacterium]NIM77608.1 GxxExxY protein [Candidatus Aminicenantes bacterium]NIN16922.1 GxxExxY protein [Candidatus Aminicenantes bacterium]NIN40815.1 GxxExxY protein [Candidatus Aminicenantes bacterium]NIN83619.1 GxxExxY protein [Candidatus Aminicenantes bacterium]
MEKKKYKFQKETYEIIGACFEVHKILGCGFLEAVYQEALEIEFKRREIPYEWEKELPIEYKGEVLKKRYNADFVCYNEIIVELKALSELREEHMAQVLNYLKATKFELGFVFNFGEKSLKYKRVIL